MFASKLKALPFNPTAVRAVSIALLAALTAASARFTLEIGPVPLTLQVMVTLLAGLTLGARDGALSQVAYLALITAGLPVDARGLGAAAWLSPTAGYLLGFVAGAFVAGWVAEHTAARRWLWRFVAALAGVAVIYTCGAGWLAVYLGSATTALTAGVMPFITADLAKAALSASLTEIVHRTLRR